MRRSLPVSEALDKLEKELEALPEGEVVKLYITRDPKGRRTALPPLELRRDEPLADQVWEHVQANAKEGGQYELRLRVNGRHFASVLVPLEFKRAAERVSNPAPVMAPPPAPSALEQVRQARELLEATGAIASDDDEDDESLGELDGDDDEDEAPPASAMVQLLGAVLEDEDVKKGTAGLFLETGNWISSDAKRREALASKLEAEAEYVRAKTRLLTEGNVVGRGASSRKVVALKVVGAEEPESAAAAGDES